MITAVSRAVALTATIYLQSITKIPHLLSVPEDLARIPVLTVSFYAVLTHPYNDIYILDGILSASLGDSFCYI